MRHLQKSLSLFLCIVLCLSFFPFSAAYAEEVSDEEADLVSVSDELDRSSEELEMEPEQSVLEADTSSEEQEELPHERSYSEELEMEPEQSVLEADTSSEEQEELPHEHSYTAIVTAPTCTEQGYTTWTCSCGDSYVDDYTDALNHPEVVDIPEVPATETNPGTTAGKKCALCGEIIEGCEEIPALEETNIIDNNQTEKDSPIIQGEDNSVSETIVEESEIIIEESETIVEESETIVVAEEAALASYPSVFFYSDADFKNLIVQDSVAIGSVYPIRMQWWAAYNNEGYDLTIYDSNNRAVAHASDTWRNTSYIKNITVTWDTKDCQPGLYKVEVVKKFYSLYRWNEAPTTSTLQLQVGIFNISYNANGGNGAPASQIKTQGQALTLSTTKPSRSNYNFLGWAESSTATSAQYQPGGQYTKDASVTLYAVWQVASPKITTHPATKTVTEGDTVKFGVKATGEGLTYQWQYRTSASGNWSNSGATGNKSATMSFTAKYSQNGYQYRCKVSNANGSVYTNAATMTVKQKQNQLPKITTHPATKTVTEGDTVKFGVKATGEGLTYQWQYRTSASGNWSNSGATGNKSATMSFTAKYSQNGYQYRCKVSNANGSVYTNAATMTVKQHSQTKTIAEGVYDPYWANNLNARLDSPEKWCSSGYARASLAVLLYYDLPSNIKNSQFKNALDTGEVYVGKFYEKGSVGYVLYYYTPEQCLSVVYAPGVRAEAVYVILDHLDNTTYNTMKQQTWKINKSDVDAVYNDAPFLK